MNPQAQLTTAAVAAFLTFAACGAPPIDSNADDAPAPTAQAALSFSADIMPILEQRCWQCHNNLLSDYARVMSTTGWCWVDEAEGSEELPFIEPGDPSRSLLFRKLRSPGPDFDLVRSCGRPMPADRTEAPYGLEELFPDEFALIERWIAEGAPE